MNHKKPLISVIMSVYNGERTVPAAIKSIISQTYENLELLIVDDASTDGTKDKLKQLKDLKKIDNLVTHKENKGKGAAVRSGIKEINGDIVIIQDADLEYNPKDYARLIKPLLDGNADVVYGSRFLGGGEDAHRVLYFWHRVANGILTTFTNILSDMNLTDMETGYKVFRKEVFNNLILRENRFGFEPEITIKLAKKKLRFFEVSVSYNGRTYQEGKKVGMKDGIRALYCLIKYRFFN